MSNYKRNFNCVISHPPLPVYLCFDPSVSFLEAVAVGMAGEEEEEVDIDSFLSCIVIYPIPQSPVNCRTVPMSFDSLLTGLMGEP